MLAWAPALRYSSAGADAERTAHLVSVAADEADALEGEQRAQRGDVVGRQCPCHSVQVQLLQGDALCQVLQVTNNWLKKGA